MILSNLKVYWFLQVSQRVWCSAAVYTFLVGIKKKKTQKRVGGGKGEKMFSSFWNQRTYWKWRINWPCKHVPLFVYCNRETRLQQVYMIRANGGFLSRGWSLSPAGSTQRLKLKPRISSFPVLPCTAWLLMRWLTAQPHCTKVRGPTGQRQHPHIEEDAQIKCGYLLFAILCWEKRGYWDEQ